MCKQTVIDSFEGKYRFLSNFSNHPVTYNGFNFLNAEAAFQAQKCPNRQNEFVNLKPNGAKHLGRRVPLRSDWEQVKDQIMYEIVKAKFTQNKSCHDQLIKTGIAYLEEGNTWGDCYWGTVMGHGENKLGEILMKVRSEISSES